jgi:hypothetical protein
MPLLLKKTDYSVPRIQTALHQVQDAREKFAAHRWQERVDVFIPYSAHRRHTNPQIIMNVLYWRNALPILITNQKLAGSPAEAPQPQTPV